MQNIDITIPKCDYLGIPFIYKINESLNNIMTMCINAVKITNSTYKKLSYIGLTQTQATRCKKLSNYQIFLDAGWSTGY